MGLTGLAGVLLPAAIGLGLLGAVEALERRFGAATAAALAARAALAGGVLAALLLGSVVRQGAELPRFWWIQIGRTTQIDWIMLLDPLALLVGGVGLLALLAAILTGLAVGPAAGGRPHARAGLAAAAAIVVGTAGTLWQAGLGLGLAALAVRTWLPAHGSPDMALRTEIEAGSPAAGLVGLGLGLAGLGWIAGAGDLEFSAIERAGLLQGGSELVRGPALAGLRPAGLAGLGLVAAALGWVLAWPRLVARAWADGPAAVAAVIGSVGPLLLVVPLRGHLALALSPAAMAWLAVLMAVAAAWAGVRAARGPSPREIVGACGQVGLASAFSTLALGAFAEATLLALAQGLALAALAVALGSGSRRAAQATVGLAAIGWVAPLGAGVAALSGGLSAWSPGINVAAPLLLLIGAAGVGVGVRRVLGDMAQETGWEPAEAPGLLVGVAALLAAAAGLVALGPLGPWLWPGFMFSRALVGAYALGPRPDAWQVPAWFGALAVAAALVAGAAALRRVRPADRVPPRWPRIGLLAGLHGLGERLWGGLVLRTGDERVAAAPRGFDLQRALLAAVAGALAIVGTVFCNPDVLRLGPTRVHPVDLGGIDAAMAGTRRAPAGSEESAGAGRATAAAEEPEVLPLAPLPRPIGPADVGAEPAGERGAPSVPGAGDMAGGAGAVTRDGAGPGDMAPGGGR